jgi:hypothetical protein
MKRRRLTEDTDNRPKDEDLWQDVLAVTKGEKNSVSRTVDGEEVTVEAPNDGDGFDVYPCVPLDSQALTREGWKAHDRIEIGDEILAYDIDENVLSWSKVEDKHRFEDAPIKRMSKDRVSFDVRCTPGHKWVAFRKNKFEDRRLIETSELPTSYNLLTSAKLSESVEGEALEELSSFDVERRHRGLQNMHIEDDGREDVWCPQTEHGTWVMRQGSTVTITGNSAYANGWAVQRYEELGGEWETVEEQMLRKVVREEIKRQIGK